MQKIRSKIQFNLPLKKSLARIGISLMCGFLVVACSALPDKYDTTLEWSENKLFNEAQEALTDKDYGTAAKYFEMFEGRYPLSAKANQALFNAAYAYYKNSDKELADQTLERFLELYPNHEKVDYALYLRGLIYFNDNLGLMGRFAEKIYDERDPKSMHLSYQAFKQLIERFPKSQYAPDALDRMRFIVNALANHEVKIARYYFQRGAYLAAAQRAENVMKLYERAPAIEEALFVMAKSYKLLQLDEQSKHAKELLEKNFPQSLFIRQL